MMMTDSSCSSGLLKATNVVGVPALDEVCIQFVSKCQASVLFAQDNNLHDSAKHTYDDSTPD